MRARSPVEGMNSRSPLTLSNFAKANDKRIPAQKALSHGNRSTFSDEVKSAKLVGMLNNTNGVATDEKASILPLSQHQRSILQRALSPKSNSMRKNPNRKRNNHIGRFCKFKRVL